MIVGLGRGVTTAWWIALGLGLVVALAVAALLELLRRTVHKIRRGTDDILAMGGRLAQNTWTIQLFNATNTRAAELYEELRSHQREERSDE